MEGLAYDRDGTIALRGRVFDPLLQELNRLEFYHLPSPKSLGSEWFLHQFVPPMEKFTIPVPDLMATVVEHISIQTGKAIDQSGANQVLTTGGGALNRFLIQRIQQHIHSEIVIPEPLLIEFKEALIFAFLGLLRIRGETNCLASVTGGRRDLSTGTVYSPK
jgi:anhydro-N-acetylmuramic acid kinase